MQLRGLFSDKPAWLDHIGQPQRIMKISDSGMGSHVLRGLFSDKRTIIKHHGLGVSIIENLCHGKISLSMKLAVQASKNLSVRPKTIQAAAA